MNREQAKAILQCCRAEGQDAGDPQVAEALALTQNDQELRAWWDSERALDLAITRKLNQTNVPAGLVEQILASHGELQTLASQRKALRSPGTYLAIAAAVVFLGVIAALFLLRRTSEPETEFSAFHREMGIFLQEFPRLDIETEKLSDVRKWLAEKPKLMSVKIPSGLQRFPSIGCREIQWRDKKAALICFMVDGEVIHLIVAAKSAFGAEREGGFEVQKAAGLTTATWQDGDLLYLAVTKGTKEFLQKHAGS